jgi:hypothetical protein
MVSEGWAAAGDFAVIGFSHAEDAVCFTARGLGDNHHARVQQTDGDEARLAVIEPIIFNRHPRAAKHATCIGKIQSAPRKGFVRLCRIIADLLFCYYKK